MANESIQPLDEAPMRVVNRGPGVFDFSFFAILLCRLFQLVRLLRRAQLPSIVLPRRSGSPAPIRAVRKDSDGHDVVVDFWKPPWAERAPSNGWPFFKRTSFIVEQRSTLRSFNRTLIG